MRICGGEGSSEGIGDSDWTIGKVHKNLVCDEGGCVAISVRHFKGQRGRSLAFAIPVRCVNEASNEMRTTG